MPDSASPSARQEEIHNVAQLPPWVFDSSPADGHPRFVVFPGKLARQEDAVTRSHQMAALEAAKMDGLYVSAKTLTQEGDYNFGYATDVKVDYLKERAPQYLDQVELDKIIHTPLGSMARYIHRGRSVSLAFTPPAGTSRPPRWISDIPKIEGYTVALGSADRHRNWDSSFTAADKNAMANLIVSLRGKLTSIKDMEEEYKRNSEYLASLETIFISGEGIIKDTMIIARWVDDGENQFYSLVAVPTPKGM